MNRFCLLPLLLLLVSHTFAKEKKIQKFTRTVYNMPAKSGEVLLKAGKFTATLKSENGRKKTGKKFKMDVELRVHVVNGLNPMGGKRVPYTSTQFNSGTESVAKKAGPGLVNLALQDAAKELRRLYPYSYYKTEDLNDSLIKYRIQTTAPGADRVALYQEIGKIMPFQDQLRLVAKLGNLMGDKSNYDNERASQFLDAKNPVLCDTIIDGMNSPGEDGVCRDIVVCQATLLYHMGNKDNVYVASFPVPGNYHVTLMVTDPNNRNVVHKVNYGKQTSEGELEGSAAIDQGQSNNVGTMVRVWKPTPDKNGDIMGTYAGVIPTELGLLLEEETSPNPRDVTGGGRFDPMTRRTYSVVHAGAGYGPLQGRVFAAKLANGDLVYGASASLNWGNDVGKKRKKGVFQGVAHKGHVGLAYAGVQSEHHYKQSETLTLSERRLDHTGYISVHEKVGIPLVINEEWTITPFTDFFVEAAVITGNSKTTGDGNVTQNVGAEVVYDNGKTKVRAHGHTQLGIGLEDIRNFSSVGVFTNYTEFGISGSTQVTSKIGLNGSVLCVLRAYQDSCMANVGGTYGGIRDTLTHSLNVGVVTPIGKERQPWAPGGSRPSLVGSYGANIRPTDNLNIRTGVNYQQSLEDNNFMLQGTLGLDWK